MNFEKIKSVIDDIMNFITEFADKLRAFIEGLKGGNTGFDVDKFNDALTEAAVE